MRGHQYTVKRYQPVKLLLFGLCVAFGLLVFQHVAAEPLGSLDRLIRRRGHRIKFVNFERNPEAQPQLDRYRGLIVLGGPMNVEDHAHRAHLLTEMRAIETALKQDKPVLGICLGAQLLAHVLGAPVRRQREAEIGWYQVDTTDAGDLGRLEAAGLQASAAPLWMTSPAETAAMAAAAISLVA